MADCFDNPLNYWRCFQPDPRSDPENIQSGLRHTTNYSCQYFIKGLPGVCIYWDEETEFCGYEVSEGEALPSGYGSKKCDVLGRRSWCDKYFNDGNEDLDEYVCIAPCFERSGLGVQIEGVDYPLFTAVSGTDILGYNKGKCDGAGLGRGEDGEGVLVEALLQMKRICNYYRPYDMGFGFTEPQQIIWTTDGTIDLAAMQAAVMDELQKRLPYHFKVYNLRAKSQKCAYWDQDYGSDFVVSTNHDGIILAATFDGSGRILECICPDDASNPYRTRDLAADALPIVARVWSSDANTIVCNGAKPECPCYTGDWKHCKDSEMYSGMKVTAEQMFELRFWIRNWSSQDEYENYFGDLPNKSDPTTADIYTFEKWEKLNATSIEGSIMLGKKIHMCMPALPGAKEFDDWAFLEYEDIKYPPIMTPVSTQEGKSRGTTVDNQVSFPNLIRDLAEENPILLEVLYPYITNDPFPSTDLLNANYGCIGQVDDTPCVKRSCETSEDEISIIGTTVRNKRLICFNLAFVDASLTYLREYDSASHLMKKHPEYGESFYVDLENFIEEIREQDISGDILHESSSDGFGLYNMGPVKLKYQYLNTIVVVLDLSTSNAPGGQKYEFRKVNVWSQWHGGMAIQSKYTRELESDSAYVDMEDITITPPGSAEMSMIPLKGANSFNLETRAADCMPVYIHTVLNQYTQYDVYGYCLKKRVVPEVAGVPWLRVGSYGVVWAGIQDVALNYLMDWDIEGKIYMDFYKMDPESETDERLLIETVEMEVIFPTEDALKITIPRNAVLLKPKDDKKRRFVATGSARAILRMSYYYTYFSNDTEVEDGEEVIWPDFSGDTKFAVPNISISADSGSSSAESALYTISNIYNRTARLACLFTDEEGALVSAVTTKLLVSIPRLFARSVEIKYSWQASGESYQLEPSKAFALKIESPISLGAVSYNTTPPCGDHEMTPIGQVGPMWYPFTNCDTYGTYDILLPNNYCLSPYDDMPRYDMRGRGPDRYHALFLGMGSIAACANDYVYGFDIVNKPSSGPSFTGVASVVPYVNPIYYEMMEWVLPPFGNTSREYVERFFSTDRITYQSSTGAGIKYETRWMPKVIDNTDLNSTFNSFGYGVESGNFTDVSQMNYLNASDISEALDNDTYRFEEIFSIRKEGRVAYPGPIIEDDERTTPFYCFYEFIEENMVWAWQDAWKEIERAQESTEKLNFIQIENPDYEFDMYKKEHRKTIDEGLHTIEFMPPEIEDGNLKKYPYIKLDDGTERYFEIMYDDYDSSEIEWKDENEGNVDGSGGTDTSGATGEGEGEEESGNVYEETSDYDVWIHDPNTLFDGEAVKTEEKAIDEEREIKYSYDIDLEEWSKGVFNRGLITKIRKDRLKHLPHTKIDWEASGFEFTPSNNGLNPCSHDQGDQRWILSNGTTCNITFSEPGCLVDMRFLGFKGYYSCNELGTEKLKSVHLCKPGVEVKINGVSVGQSSYELPTTKEIRERYNNIYQIAMSFDVDPSLMVNPSDEVLLTFSLPSGYSALIDGEENFRFQRGEYIEATETIRVWERKYKVSRGIGMGDYNLNGPQRPCSPKFGFESGGIYWPRWTSTAGNVVAIDKLRSVFAGEYFPDKQAIFPGGGATILTKEETEQKDIYEQAWALESVGDKKTYNHYLPPVIDTFFTTIGGVSLPSSSMVCEAYKFAWKNNAPVLAYEEIEVWQPKGHLFRWNTDQKVGIRCYEFGPIEEIFQVDFVHMHGGGESTEPTGNAFTAYAGLAKVGYLFAKSVDKVKQAVNS